MSGGRPSDYEPEFCNTAFAMSQEGATVREIAEALEVNEVTIWRWQQKHPEFRKSMQLGKDAADDRVEHSLYRRATGYSFDSIKIMTYEGAVIVEPFVEHVPPDVNAAKFWLQNRRGVTWKEKSEHEHKGVVNLNVTPKDASVL